MALWPEPVEAYVLIYFKQHLIIDFMSSHTSVHSKSGTRFSITEFSIDYGPSPIQLSTTGIAAMQPQHNVPLPFL